MNIEQVFPYSSVNEHNGLSTLAPEVETHEASLQPLNAKDIGKIETTNYLEQQDSALCKGCDPIETLSTALRSQSSTSNYERDESEEDSDDSDDSDEEEDMHFRRKRICLAEKKALDLDNNKEAEVETLASYIERKALDNNSGKYVDNALNVNSDNTITVKNSHVDVRSNPPPPAKFFMPAMGVYPMMPSHNIFMQPYGMPSGQSLGYIPPPPVDNFNKLNTDFSIAEDNKQVGEQIRINISKVQAKKTENLVNKKNTVYLSKVPRKINSMEALSAIFKKFGTILNLNIDIRKNMAQIEYKSELEAQKAIVMSNRLKGSLFSDNDVIISKTPQLETKIGNQTEQKSKLTAEAVQNILTSKIRELLQERSKQEDKKVFDEMLTKVKDLMSRLRKDPVVEKFEDDLEEIGVSLY